MPPRLVVRGVSEKNREGKRSARERLREEREQDKAREQAQADAGRGRRRWSPCSALAAVVGVLAANGGRTTGQVAAARSSPRRRRPARTAWPSRSGKASAPSTLTVYEDFRCPACKQFEDIFRPTSTSSRTSGQLKVEYHLVTLIDGNLGGSGSLHAANAAACAQDAGKFRAYHDVLYRQPAGGDRGRVRRQGSKLIKLAGKVPGLDTPAFRTCVEDGTHDGWVAKSNSVFSTPAYSSHPDRAARRQVRSTATRRTR